mgnify:CR=1 FL=1
MFPNPEDWQAPKTPCEMRQMIRDYHRALDGDEEAENAYRLKEHPWKVFREEVQPIGAIIWAVFGARDGVRITFPLLLDPRDPEYDALIECGYSDQMTRIYVQATLALGEQHLFEDKMRMEVLNSSGRVPATGPICREKKGHRGEKGSIRFEDDADNARSVERVGHLIIKAIEKKRQKQHAYPRPVWLVVVCDDLIPSPLANPDIANALGRVPRLALLDMLYAQKLAEGLQFQRVFLVGQTGRFLQELPSSEDCTAPDNALEGGAS